MWFALFIPFVFAFMDRFRGTDGPLSIGNSIFYSITVGVTVWVFTGEAYAGMVSVGLFFFGETRNWQEIGYYINGSRNLATISELVFRGLLWYGPTFAAAYFFGSVSLLNAVAGAITAALTFWWSVAISEWLWWHYGEHLTIRWKYFYIGNVWTLNEAVRGFLFGLCLFFML